MGLVIASLVITVNPAGLQVVSVCALKQLGLSHVLVQINWKAHPLGQPKRPTFRFAIDCAAVHSEVANKAGSGPTDAGVDPEATEFSCFTSCSAIAVRLADMRYYRGKVNVTCRLTDGQANRSSSISMADVYEQSMLALPDHTFCKGQAFFVKPPANSTQSSCAVTRLSPMIAQQSITVHGVRQICR